MTMDEKADENRKEVLTADNVGGKRRRKTITLKQKVEIFLCWICKVLFRNIVIQENVPLVVKIPQENIFDESEIL